MKKVAVNGNGNWVVYHLAILGNVIHTRYCNIWVLYHMALFKNSILYYTDIQRLR